MIHRTPTLTDEDEAVLDLIGKQRDRLRIYTQHNVRRWTGSLRRTTFARAIRGSNSIEGYNASMDDAVAVVDNEPPLDERTETYLAIKGYRDALTYIMQAAQDTYFQFGKQFLKSLHFMMLGHDLSKYPGQWRPGAVFVVNGATGETVYEAPDASLVDGLVQELVASIEGDTKTPPIIKGAMAHLNLTMIHPFKDGNGRMARAIQTLVISRDGILHPVFSSIEEWLGQNTHEYYNKLAEIGRGGWNPKNDALLWIRFCLKAHYQQAQTLLRRNEEYGELFSKVQDILVTNKLPDRMVIPLFDAALGLHLSNSRYRSETEVTEFVASRDLKKLCEMELLEPKGERRGRVYSAARILIEARNSVRKRTPLADPYAIVRQASEEPRLPGF